MLVVGEVPEVGRPAGCSIVVLSNYGIRISKLE
jgi:hypothetical protein